MVINIIKPRGFKDLELRLRESILTIYGCKFGTEASKMTINGHKCYQTTWVYGHVIERVY